jgi:3-dehydroquinate dehydratase-1
MSIADIWAGGVSFVVNAEPESLASAFLLLHDTSVCAMAVRVKDVQAALNRAASLGCPVVPQAKLGVVDERVVAIQTPDEALMYLVDSTEAWKMDFVFEEERQNGYLPSQTTYNAVDHIAQALDRLSMDRFVLFYKSVFGMYPQQTIELQDLYGLTRSRAMVTPNHALRFPLNISDGKDTSIGRLVSEAAGSIVHHIAFHTDDIFETVLELRRNCSQDRFLRVPQSYYDDLRVRHGLASEFISKMRSYNIMYDRDAKGEFLHLSTEQFANRYFFEIVQRIDGYEHFASANAPIRMSIHHERRNLGMDISSALSPQTTGPGGLPGADRDLIVVFEPGFEAVVDLVADILGKESSLDPTSTAGVIGIPIASALQWLVDVDRARYITINTHCIENSSLDAVEAVSKLCQHEFLFSKTEQCRRDLTRVLSFILGQTKPHEAIIRKIRSTFITLTFPDIRTALANLDILTVGADAIELRVDLLREGSGNGSDNPVPSLDYVAKQVMWLRQRTELPIIFTLRSQTEGGRCPSSNEDIAKYFLLKGLKWGCEYIDVEVRLPEETRKYLAAHKGHSKIMASFHDMAGNLKWLSSDTQRLYHTARAYGDVIKIFGFATSFSQNYELEYFRSSMSRSFSHPFIAMNAGQVGQLSRILNHFFTPTTHPLLPMAAAPGQLSAAEINSALHIMGQVSKRTVFTIGSSRAIPPRMFWEKCFNELGLPHQYASIDRISENMIQQLTRQLSFGGAIIRPPLTARSGFISSFTEEARESGVVDTISVRTVGNQSVIVGDNSTAKSLRSLLIRDFAPSAYVGQPVLVVSSSVEDAASALWALRSLRCGEVYTIGFRVPDGGGTQCNNFEEVGRLRSPFVVVNALRGERGAIVKPLLRMVEGHPVPRRGDGVLVDLAGAGMGGGNGKWKVVEAEEVREGMLVEALEALVGQRVGGNFVGMAGGWGA